MDKVSKLTAEQKRKKLEANRAKALQRKQQLIRGISGGSNASGGLPLLNTTSAGNNSRANSYNNNNKPSNNVQDSRNAQDAKSAQENKKSKYKYRNMIKKSDYIQYDIANTEDLKGGYLLEPLRNDNNGEKNTLEDWKEKERMKQEFIVKDPPPPVDIQNAPKCYECNTIDINQQFYTVYGCRVCNKCKEKFPEKYSLLTKTECKQDYFLTEPELMDTTIFSKIEKPNPHHNFSRMQLYLRYQIEEFAFKKWGGADGLDAEWLRRQQQKMDRKNKRFETKLQEMKMRTRAEEYTRKLREKANDGYGHVHDWSAPLQMEGAVVKRRCIDCGLETEEISF